MPDFSVKELAEMIAARVAQESGRRFTGQIRFNLHLRDGGVGRVQCEISEDLQRAKVPEGSRG